VRAYATGRETHLVLSPYHYRLRSSIHVTPVSYETFCGDSLYMKSTVRTALHLLIVFAPNTPNIQPILLLKENFPYRPGLLPKLPQRIPPLYRHHFRASTNIRSGWSAPLPHRKPFGVQESGTFLPEPCFRKPTPFPGFDRYGQQYVCRHLMASFAAALTGYCRQYRVHTYGMCKQYSPPTRQWPI